jgi:hypothetical protein
MCSGRAYRPICGGVPLAGNNCNLASSKGKGKRESSAHSRSGGASPMTCHDVRLTTPPACSETVDAISGSGTVGVESENEEEKVPVVEVEDMWALARSGSNSGFTSRSGSSRARSAAGQTREQVQSPMERKVESVKSRAYYGSHPQACVSLQAPPLSRVLGRVLRARTSPGCNTNRTAPYYSTRTSAQAGASRAITTPHVRRGFYSHALTHGSVGVLRFAGHPRPPPS